MGFCFNKMRLRRSLDGGGSQKKVWQMVEQNVFSFLVLEFGTISSKTNCWSWRVDLMGVFHTLTLRNSLAHFMWTPNVHQFSMFDIPALIGNGGYGLCQVCWNCCKGQVTWISFKTQRKWGFLTRQKNLKVTFIPLFLLSTGHLKKKLLCWDSSNIFLQKKIK